MLSHLLKFGPSVPPRLTPARFASVQRVIETSEKLQA
jgi:hypothetical protein